MDKRSKTITEIEPLLENLDLEDLLFLKNQAEVMVHNKNVLERRKEAAARKDEPSEEEGHARSGKSNKKAKKAVPRRGLSIEQSDNPKYFNICAGDSRIFMDRHEIKALYKIAAAASGSGEACPRLYRWLKKERSDVLGEAHISGAASPVLAELYKALIDNFTTG